jgi:hypothetical protein
MVTASQIESYRRTGPDLQSVFPMTADVLSDLLANGPGTI